MNWEDADESIDCTYRCLLCRIRRWMKEQSIRKRYRKLMEKRQQVKYTGPPLPKHVNCPNVLVDVEEEEMIE